MKKFAKWFLVIACLAVSGSALAKKPATSRAVSSPATINFETVGQDWTWTLFNPESSAILLWASE